MEHLQQTVDQLLAPSDTLVREMAALEGDILLLGIGGKIGPSLARLAKAAVDKSGIPRRIIGASRLTEPGLKEALEASGIEAIPVDLLNEQELQALPDVKNVIYLAGTKFGTTGNEAFTWAMNTYLPGRVAEKYKNSRIIVYSTGNVYPFTWIGSGGADEHTSPAPVGEYGQSCLGRERIFQHFSQKYHTPLLIYRLNYANDLRYGVLLEIAKTVLAGKYTDTRMGHVNVIWQGDANEIALRAFHHCAIPAKILNVTGPETVSVKWIAQQFGRIMQQDVVFINQEEDTALLSNAAECVRLFGYPKVGLLQMIELTVAWLMEGRETIKKPTHFQERAGQF